MECWKRWAEETVRIWTFLDTMLSPKHLDLWDLPGRVLQGSRTVEAVRLKTGWGGAIIKMPPLGSTWIGWDREYLGQILFCDQIGVALSEPCVTSTGWLAMLRPLQASWDSISESSRTPWIAGQHYLTTLQP
jgi:hypothetical protein